MMPEWALSLSFIKVMNYPFVGIDGAQMHTHSFEIIVLILKHHKEFLYFIRFIHC